MAGFNEKEIIDGLKKEGLKITPQRLGIVKLLAKFSKQKKHPSADEIYTELVETYPTISYATIYKTLEILVKLGFISEINVDSTKKRYELIGKSHYHFVCQKCEKIFDVEEKIDLKEFVKLAKLENFEIKRVEVVLYGLCPRCK